MGPFNPPSSAVDAGEGAEAAPTIIFPPTALPRPASAPPSPPARHVERRGCIMPILMDEAGNGMNQFLSAFGREAARSFFSRMLSRSKAAEAQHASKEAGPNWESSVFESEEAASKVADELFARDIPFRQREDILSYQAAHAEPVERIARALGVGFCAVASTDDRVAGTRDARDEARSGQRADPDGDVRRWTRISVEDPDFAKQFASDLREAHIGADCAGCDVVFPEAHLRAFQAYCAARGGKYPGIAGLEREIVSREPLVRPATQRQVELMERLAREGRIPAAEMETFKSDPTFDSARSILNARSGQVIDSQAVDPLQGAKDTDRDRIADANEDLDSDGLDFAREEDARVQATEPVLEREARDEQADRDERLPDLEAECSQAAAVDQPSQRGRSEVFIGPESR